MLTHPCVSYLNDFLCFSYGGFHAKGGKTAGEIHISMKGLMMILLYCFISGLSGVYTEYILKQHYQVIVIFKKIFSVFFIQLF